MLTKFFSDDPDQRLPVTFDNWSTPPAFCQCLDQTFQTAYVGTLADDDQVICASGAQRLDVCALPRQEEHHEARKHGTTPVFHNMTMGYQGERETSDRDCHTHRLHNVGKPRLVINHRKADLADTAMFLMSNPWHWQAQGITRLRRHRWPVEVYHEEGKADGLDQYQVRDFQAIYRHIALVAVTYSWLRAAQHDRALLHILQQQIKTRLDGSAGSCRRHTQAQARGALATFIATALSQGETLSEVMPPFIAAVCSYGTAWALPKADDELDLGGSGQV